MNSSLIKKIVLCAVELVVFLVLALAVPFPKTGAYAGAYWVSFAFCLIAVLAQFYVVYTAFHKGVDVKSKFYGFPLLRIGYLYLAVQLIAGFIVMALGFVFVIPLWIPAVLFVALFGIAAGGLVAADMVRAEVERQDEKLKTDVRNMRALQSRSASAAQLCGDPETKRVLTELAEKFRYSDPVSSDALRPIESNLLQGMEELYASVMSGDYYAARQHAGRLEAILNERNRLCKLNK